MLYTFLKLIRYQNLLLIISTQLLIKFALFEAFHISTTLSTLGYALLCFSTVCIAAAGNIINDVNDIETDRINKPSDQIVGKLISEKAAINVYIILTVMGVGTGFYLSNLVERPGFSAIFIIISALLYLYATYIKNIMLLGNIVISGLVAMVIIIAGIFELLPAITPSNQQTQAIIFSILLDYAFFAFMINCLREMVKDQEDVKGDYNTGRNTLPVALGKNRANKVIFIVGLVPVISVLYYMYNYLFTNMYAQLYALVLIIGPLLYFLSTLFSSKTKKDFARLSLILKIVMILGLVSLGLYPFILL